MSKEYLIEYSDRASLHYGRLSPSIQERVDHLIQRLQEVGLRTRHIKKIYSDQDMYLGQVTRDLRIIFNISDDVITVLDIVRHDKLRGYLTF